MKTEACAPVEQQFGSPIDPDFLSDDFVDERERTVDQILGTYGIGAETLGPSLGAQARLTRKVLGCEACGECSKCPVSERLQEISDATAAMQREKALEQQLINVPEWLSIGRIESVKEDKALLSSLPGMPYEEQLKVSLQGTHVDKLPSQSLQNLIGSISDSKVEGIRLTKEDGPVIDIFDAREAIGFKGLEPTQEEYGVLYKKLYKLLTSENEAGEPIILHPEKSKGKGRGIHATLPNYVGKGVLSEVRMGSKARFYMIINQPTNASGDHIASVTLVGTHGDNVAMQQQFLDRVNHQVSDD
jgi:hypothetical protein